MHNQKRLTVAEKKIIIILTGNISGMVFPSVNIRRQGEPLLLSGNGDWL